MAAKLKRLFSVFAIGIWLQTPLCVCGAEPLPAPTAPADSPLLSYRTVYPQWAAMTPQRMQQELKHHVAELDAALEEIRKVNPQDACWENTFAPFEQALCQIRFMGASAATLADVCADAEHRQQYQALCREISILTVKVFHDDKIWNLMKAAVASPATQSLPPQQRSAMECICDRFKSNGADLSPETRARATKIYEELIQLGYDYQRNIEESVAKVQLHVTEQVGMLNGVPGRLLLRARNNAKREGKKGLLFRVEDNTLRWLLTTCKSEEGRKLAWEAWCTLAHTEQHDNVALAARILALRHELALSEGYSSYADAVGDQLRMLSTGKAALAFIDDMLQRMKPAFDAEVAEILRLYNEAEHKNVQALPPWDLPYAQNLYAEQSTALQSNDISDFLPTKEALRGALALFSKLYSIRIVERETMYLPGADPASAVQVWHPAVACYEVYDKESSALLGLIYLDMFDRPGKPTVTQASYVRDSSNGTLPHVAIVQLNISGDTLSHRELCALFHEWGHALQFVMGQGCVYSQNAFGQEIDFIEFASTFNALWANEPQVLAEFARHYSTGEPCPLPLLEAACRNHAEYSVSTIMDRLRDFKVDMEMHLFYEEKFKGKDFNEAAYAVVKPWMVPLTETPPSHLLLVPHCMRTMYGSNYYSYMWCEVMAADAFSGFRTPDGFDFSLGLELRRAIFEKGASEPAMEMFRKFMGRPPQPDAYLEYLKQNQLTPQQIK